MPDLSGRELLREWRRLMDSLVTSAASVAGRSELPRQLLEPMQRQLELVEEIVERERRLQKDVANRVFGPVDAVFDLLGESAVMLARQAEALESAGRAIEQTAALVKAQAALFERTIGTLRQPSELAKRAAGADRKPRKRSSGGKRA